MGTVWRYVVQMAIPCLFGVFLWGLTHPLRKSYNTRHGVVSGAGREKALFLLFLFTAGLLALTLTPAGFWASILQWRLPQMPPPFQGEINLIPIRQSLKLLQYYMKNGLWDAILINFPGNIIMFLPFGFFAGLLMDKPRWWKSTLVTFGVSLFIESFQLFVSRGTDVDDLILNTLGGLLGHGCFLLLRKVNPGLVRRCGKSQKGSI
ncbi:MAG: VanZ family protein [Oscillospiraceae bacterium]|nr:VanZ family protein [Oscillospiraceae bacterium]